MSSFFITCSKCKERLFVATRKVSKQQDADKAIATAKVFNWSVKPFICSACNGKGVKSTRALEDDKARYWLKQYEVNPEIAKFKKVVNVL